MAEQEAVEMANRLLTLRAAVDRVKREAEQHARSGVLEFDERTRWRRFAAQLAEALK